MTIKKLVAALAATMTLTAPMTLAAPAEAKSSASCVVINGPGSHTVKVGKSVQVHVRLSKACRNSKISIFDEPARRAAARYLQYSTAWYFPGEQSFTIEVNPPKGQGKSITKTIAYKVVAS